MTDLFELGVAGYEDDYIFVKSTQSKFTSAKIIADSVTTWGKRIISYEVECPRYVWAEMLTHRLFSRNAASSRAIPVMKKIAMVWKNPVVPIKWGKNKAGMQSEGVLTGWRKALCRWSWVGLSKLACIATWTMTKCGLHKQWAGRPLEWFEQYKAVITSTEWENFFYLRDHEAAMPDIQDLAACMRTARKLSIPVKLKHGQWHLPYVQTIPTEYGTIYKVGTDEVSLEQAKKISASCCAQTSYRKHDESLQKADMIYKKLIESKPSHWSPVEHQATPMAEQYLTSYTYGPDSTDGCTHMQLDTCELWSGNFKGWIQLRQIIQMEYGDLPMTVR